MEFSQLLLELLFFICVQSFQWPHIYAVEILSILTCAFKKSLFMYTCIFLMDVNKHFMNHINKWKLDRKQINGTVRQRLDLQCWISRLINIALISWYEWLLLSSCSNSYCLWKGSHCQHLCLVTLTPDIFENVRLYFDFLTSMHHQQYSKNRNII